MRCRLEQQILADLQACVTWQILTPPQAAKVALASIPQCSLNACLNSQHLPWHVDPRVSRRSPKYDVEMFAAGWSSRSWQICRPA